MREYTKIYSGLIPHAGGTQAWTQPTGSDGLLKSIPGKGLFTGFEKSPESRPCALPHCPWTISSRTATRMTTMRLIRDLSLSAALELKIFARESTPTKRMETQLSPQGPEGHCD